MKQAEAPESTRACVVTRFPVGSRSVVGTKSPGVGSDDKLGTSGGNMEVIGESEGCRVRVPAKNVEDGGGMETY